jgi:hypothetical protein
MHLTAYLLDITDRDDHWRIIRIDEATYKETYRKEYKKFSDMPKKIQEVVSILKMCKPDETVEGVGRRISNTTFWVEETGLYVKGAFRGDDARSKGKKESEGAA